MTDRKNNGFTIVELLIVIVVIGVLGALSIAAFNGTQQRARTSLWLTRADQWEKYLRNSALLSATGQLPRTAGSQYRCLGRDIAEFPAEGAFLEGECAVVIASDGTRQNWNLYYSQSFMDDLQIASNRPIGKLPTFSTQAYGGTYYVRGIYVSIPASSSSNSPYLEWDANITNGCGRAESWSGGLNEYYDYCGLELRGI